MADHIKFIKKIIILSIILTVLLLTINQIYLSVILKEKNIYRNQEQFLEYKKNNPLKIVIFGDSLPVYDINPEYINNSFNLATPAENFEQTYYKVKWVIENEPEVDIFVLEYNYHLFNYYRIKPYYDTRYWKNFLSYAELSKVTNRTKLNLYITVSIPVIGKGEEIFQFFSERKTPTKMGGGWYNDNTVFPEDGRNGTLVGKTRVHNQFPNHPEVKEDHLADMFFNTLILLEENNKTVILVKYPLTNEYLTPLEKETNISEQYNEIDKKIESFNHITVLDYLEILRYNQSLFIDSDHLNYKGAEILSKKLAEEIKKDFKS